MMNVDLNKLFPVQEKLDKKIAAEKHLGGRDLFKRKIVALVCELYECVNEAKFFKFWSENQKANTWEEIECTECRGFAVFYYDSEQECCEHCGGEGVVGERNPLLEEYVDTIHFMLSIANDLGYKNHKYIKTETRDLNELVIGITNVATILSKSKEHHHMNLLMNNIIQLGYQLEFTKDQVVEAYFEKNKENHVRQVSGY